jgi:hypothetical protein
MAHDDKVRLMAGAAGNSSSSRFADRKSSFDEESGGTPDIAPKSGTGYPGPEVPQGRKFDPEEGGDPDVAPKSGTGYPGPEVPPGQDFEPEDGGPVDSAVAPGRPYPGPDGG